MKLRGMQPIFLAAIVLILASCSGVVNGVPEPLPAPPSSVAAGRRLLAGYGCGTCHSIPGVPGADGMAAPPLDCFYERSYIAGRLANTPENLTAWIEHPQSLAPGTAMPEVGASREQAGDMAAYLDSRAHLWRLDQILATDCP